MAKSPAYLISIPARLRPSLLDWTALEDELGRQDAKTREEAFHAFLVNHLFDLNSGTIRYWKTDGGNDRGVDAIVIDDAERRIHVLTAKCVKAFEKCGHNYPSAEVDKALTFLDELVHKNLALLKSNPVLVSAVGEIWECMSQNYHTLHLHVCSNQSPLVAEERRRLELNLSAKKISLEEHHLLSISGEKLRVIKPKTHRLDFLGQKIERTPGNIRTITGFVSAGEVARFLSAEDGSLDISLFNANIRDFLGSKTPINRQIAKTLAGGERELFECLNNGLKLVCDSVLTAGGTQPVYISNPQIINGLQTANVLFGYAAAQSERANIVSVLVQITETTDAKLVSRIALATNNQQRIGARNLRANDGLQIKLERELKKKGFRYLRKQGAISAIHNSQTVELSKLGQIILAYLLDQPGRAKTSNAIFGDLYEEVFNPKILSADIVISLYSMYRKIEGRRQIAKALQRKISRSDYDEEWIIEGIFHVLYAVKLFCVGYGLDPADFDAAHEFVDAAIETIAECFEKSEAPAYRFFRLTATKSAIEHAVMQKVLATPSIAKPSHNLQLDLF